MILYISYIIFIQYIIVHFYKFSFLYNNAMNQRVTVIGHFVSRIIQSYFSTFLSDL